jgi:LVIVD repeat-containing protein
MNIMAIRRTLLLLLTAVLLSCQDSSGPSLPPDGTGFTIAAGGNNVLERYSSDLWVHGNYAYTGTWGSRNGALGNVMKVWALDATGSPSVAGSVTVAGIGTVSDLQVSDDGQLLVASGERGSNGGIFVYGLTDPAQPSLVGSALVGPAGVHTVTLSAIGGRLYAFAARNPGPTTSAADDPALVIYDLSNPASPTQVARVPVARNYGIHDTFVRDGIAFVFAWNAGVIIYDVGNGARGGTPTSPVELSRLITSANRIAGGPAVHNGWWFYNPVTGEKRYLFIGQEGPGVLGSRSAGDIHVVDVSDLATPREVAFLHISGAGTHNFWMDEARQILYAAYYNAGVVALDVSGTLSGNLAGRVLGRIRPGGADHTFTWGVQLANGSLYAIDMVSGLWQLKTE